MTFVIFCNYDKNSRNFNEISIETTTDTENNNETRIYYNNKNPAAIKPTKPKLQTKSPSTSSKFSKFNNSVTHSAQSSTKQTPKTTPYTLVKSKSDLMSLKTYPNSFTIVSSPFTRSPSAGGQKTRKPTLDKEKDEDGDSLMDFDWIKPAPEKLYEAAQYKEKDYDVDPRDMSMPTTPILTDKVNIGNKNR